MTTAPIHDGIPATLAHLAVPVDTLTPYPGNPRRGSVDLIAESLAAHGQYRPIVVRTSTREVLAGNHTVQAARSLGWSHVAATFVDVDDDTAARIVLVDNRAADAATYDDRALADLLASLAADAADPALNPDPFAGTGFGPDDLADLLAALDGPTGPAFDPIDAAPRLDEMAPRPCQRCGYDVANDPDGLAHP